MEEMFTIVYNVLFTLILTLMYIDEIFVKNVYNRCKKNFLCENELGY